MVKGYSSGHGKHGSHGSTGGQRTDSKAVNEAMKLAETKGHCFDSYDQAMDNV